MIKIVGTPDQVAAFLRAQQRSIDDAMLVVRQQRDKEIEEHSNTVNEYEAMLKSLRQRVQVLEEELKRRESGGPS